MGGGDLNLKKSWHPHTMKNQEKLWKAEQAEKAEKQKLNELQRELADERSREDLKRIGQSSGVLAQSDDQKLEWMYKGPSDLLNREEYLLGRNIDKNFEQLDAAEKAEKEKQLVGVTVPKNHVEHECIPFSIRAYRNATNAEQVDLQRKILEDPLMSIKQKEMESRRKILENPVRLKELHKILKKQQEHKKSSRKEKKSSKKSKKSKKGKKRKKSSKSSALESDSDDGKDEDLDAILAKKYKKIQGEMKIGGDSEMDLNKLLKMKYKKITKEIDRAAKSKKKSGRDNNRSGSGDSRSDTSDIRKDSHRRFENTERRTQNANQRQYPSPKKNDECQRKLPPSYNNPFKTNRQPRIQSTSPVNSSDYRHSNKISREKRPSPQNQATFQSPKRRNNPFRRSNTRDSPGYLSRPRPLNVQPNRTYRSRSRSFNRADQNSPHRSSSIRGNRRDEQKRRSRSRSINRRDTVQRQSFSKKKEPDRSRSRSFLNQRDRRDRNGSQSDSFDRVKEKVRRSRSIDFAKPRNDKFRTELKSSIMRRDKFQSRRSPLKTRSRSKSPDYNKVQKTSASSLEVKRVSSHRVRSRSNDLQRNLKSGSPAQKSSTYASNKLDRNIRTSRRSRSNSNSTNRSTSKTKNDKRNLNIKPLTGRTDLKFNKNSKRSRSASSSSRSSDRPNQKSSLAALAKHPPNYKSSSSSSSEESSQSDSSESSRPAKKNYGLVSGDGRKLQLKKLAYSTLTKNSSPESSRRRRSESQDKTKKSIRPQRDELIAEEKNKKLKEMMENATWRDKEREQYVKKYRKEYDNESKAHESRDFDKNFINKELHKAMLNQKTVESRIKSNINNIQRSGRSMDTNFAKR